MMQTLKNKFLFLKVGTNLQAVGGIEPVQFYRSPVRTGLTGFYKFVNWLNLSPA